MNLLLDTNVLIDYLGRKEPFFPSAQKVVIAGFFGDTQLWPVDLTGASLERAARLGWDDFEDCLIALAAERVGADYLITRDAKGFARSTVPAVSPDAWLDIMREEHGLDYGEVQL